MAFLILTEAEHILAAAKAEVLDMGAKMSVSVVDPQGRPDSHVQNRWRFLAHASHIPCQGGGRILFWPSQW